MTHKLNKDAAEAVFKILDSKTPAHKLPYWFAKYKEAWKRENGDTPVKFTSKMVFPEEPKPTKHLYAFVFRNGYKLEVKVLSKYRWDARVMVKCEVVKVLDGEPPFTVGEEIDVSENEFKRYQTFEK
jgi:hypothetical protein